MNKWNIIAFSTETSGAIRRTTVGPPVNNEVVPPHPPVGADGNDPIHPDDHGPPPEDDVNMPPNGANDSGEQDDDSDFDMDESKLEILLQVDNHRFHLILLRRCRRRRQKFNFRQHSHRRSQILMRPLKLLCNRCLMIPVRKSLTSQNQKE